MSTLADAVMRARVLALAALLECGACVDELARSGNVQREPAHALINSLLRFEWQRVEDIYGGEQTLHRGLRRLEAALSLTSDREQAAALRYALALAHLGKRLGRDRERLTVIRTRLEQLPNSGDRFVAELDELATPLAAIYQDTISSYRFRIKVVGNADHLRDPQVVARIRALLLAGVRTAVLWRFVGGSLPGLLLDRTRLASACRALRSGS